MKNLQNLLEENDKRFEKVYQDLRKRVLNTAIIVIILLCFLLIPSSFFLKCLNLTIISLVLIFDTKSTQITLESLKNLKNTSDEIHLFMIMHVQLNSISSLCQTLEFKQKYEETKERLTDLIGPDWEDNNKNV